MAVDSTTANPTTTNQNTEIYEWEGGDSLPEVIRVVRSLISDDAHLYTDTFITDAINESIKLISWEEDAEKIFKCKLQTELATINADGTPAARWTLKIPGTYRGKEYFNFVSLDGCYSCLKPCYKKPEDFFRCCAFPENECPGEPCYYTIEQIGDNTTIIFDRPPNSLVGINALIYIVPQDVTPKNKTIPLARAYRTALTELVKIIINKEQDSFDQARMRYEDYDKHIRDIIQGMALTRMDNEAILLVNGGLE